MKLSVIVPVYNSEKYLRQCLDSLISQTYADMQIVLVNDGSKDGSGAICEEYKQKYSRIVKYLSKQNEGVMAAWIDGVKIADGEYIGFVDSDDYCDSTRFKAFMDSIELTDADITIGSYKTVDENGQIHVVGKRAEKLEQGVCEKAKLEDIKNSFYLGPAFSALRWEKVVKKQLIVNNMHYFDTKISMGDDIVFTIATLLDAKKISIIDDNGYYYRYNDASITHSFSQKRIEELCRLYRNMDYICNEKGYDACRNLEYKRQLSATISLLLKSNMKLKEKWRLLKELRNASEVRAVLSNNQYPQTSYAVRLKLSLFSLRCYAMLLLLAQIKNK